MVNATYNFLSKATLKKKFVSCPPGGHNCGQSGGHKIFFFGSIYLFLCTEMMWKMLGKKDNLGNVKKMYPFGTHKLTRPADRKQNYL